MLTKTIHHNVINSAKVSLFLFSSLNVLVHISVFVDSGLLAQKIAERGNMKKDKGVPPTPNDYPNPEVEVNISGYTNVCGLVVIVVDPEYIEPVSTQDHCTLLTNVIAVCMKFQSNCTLSGCIMFFCHYYFSLWMCPFDSIVSLGVEVDSVAFSQFWKVLFLFSGVMFSVRSFVTISG